MSLPPIDEDQQLSVVNVQPGAVENDWKDDLALEPNPYTMGIGAPVQSYPRIAGPWGSGWGPNENDYFRLEHLNRICAQPPLRKQDGVALLEDNEEDLWLWVEGDEKFLSAAQNNLGPVNNNSFDNSSYNVQSSLRAHLWKRRRESPQQSALRLRVQKADPSLRVAMITWLMLTSKTAKRADASQGRADREHWDIMSLIQRWWECLGRAVQVHLMDNADDDVFGEFVSRMKKADHTCTRTPTGLARLKAWVYMRSLLYPSRRDEVVNLDCSTRSPCHGCFKSASSYPLPADLEMQASQGTLPRPCFVILRVLWYKVEGSGYDCWPYDATLSSFMDKVFSSSCSTTSESLLFRPSTLDAVDLLIMHADASKADKSVTKLPWVNLYPPKSHFRILDSFPEWWNALREDLPTNILRMSDAKGISPNCSIDIFTWMAAVVLQMIPQSQKADQLDIFACAMRGILSEWSDHLGMGIVKDASDVGDLFVSAKLFLRGSHALLFPASAGNSGQEVKNIPDVESCDASWEITPQGKHSKETPFELI